MVTPKLRTTFDPTILSSKYSTVVYPKKKMAIGGEIDPNEVYRNRLLDNSVGNIVDDPYDPSLNMGTPISKPTGSFGDTANALVPYASNIVNSFRKLPSPITPPQESVISPDLVNLDAQRNNINQQTRSFNNETDYRVTSPSVAQAIKAVGLGRAIQGRNELATSEANANAQIKNQTKQFNQGVIGRNIARTQGYNDQLLSRRLKQQEFDSENVADVSNKFQMIAKDKRLMDQEDKKLDILPTLYKDTGVFDRNYLSELEKERYKKTTNRFGGRIKRW